MMVPLLSALILFAFIPNGLLAVPSTFVLSYTIDLYLICSMLYESCRANLKAKGIGDFGFVGRRSLGILRASENALKESINYQVISPYDLAKSVITEAGWSKFLCKGKKFHEPLDLALLFVGRELQSSDLSMNKHADSSLLDLLKISFARSNTSVAFPYVYASEDLLLENTLVSGFSEACGDDMGIANVAFHGSCSMGGTNHEEITALQSVQDYLTKRMEDSHRGKTDLVVFCNGGSQAVKNVDGAQSEGEVLSNVISSVEESGAKYAVLYVSDPSRSIQYPSYRDLQRFLAESTESNKSTSCDEVCLLKSSLLEGILVGIVLLIILISGLCCMMGIDTPTRFETPQE
ncbi:unnamed protein product [Sphenostylis stenocarpa]|uniref:V-type proton ATPase subunit S1/VOA1 transmembrane domain-containing protein n=1 Tax=Sphenostylis stenocarpa TaxID=92480 RepID=A0AA86SB28_9FABA|nr:unnamed protein product [Sphenostylis stenocarpa]